MSDEPLPNRREFIAKVTTGTAAAALAASCGKSATPPAAPAREKLGQAFFYDVDKFRQVDPALVHYAETGQFDCGMKGVRSLACGDGIIAVAGDREVRLYSVTGAEQARLPMPAEPRGLSLRGQRLLVGLDDRLAVFALDGKPELSCPAIPGGQIVSVDGDGEHLVAADAANRAVWRYGADGSPMGQIGERDEARNIPGFVVPSPYFALRLAPDGLLRVVNPGRHRVEAYTLNGDLEFWWGQTAMSIEGFCGCCNPVHFTVLPDGRYVTAEKGMPRVKVYGADGTFESVVAPPTAFNQPTAYLEVAAGADGTVFVLDPPRRQVRFFHPKEVSHDDAG